jgi:hypothetical protein
MTGKTPFHAFNMPDLVAKINLGDYSLQLDEPLTIECALFLCECLQADENQRIDTNNICEHPFTKPIVQGDTYIFSKLDRQYFTQECANLLQKHQPVISQTTS